MFAYEQVLPLGFQFPARMSVLPLGAGKLALVSPVPIDDALAAAIAELGRVELLIAPNLLHHLYIDAAARRYPEARARAERAAPNGPTFASTPPSTARCRPSSRPPVVVAPIEGAPALASSRSSTTPRAPSS